VSRSAAAAALARTMEPNIMIDGTTIQFLELDRSEQVGLRDLFLKLTYNEFDRMEAFIADSERAIMKALAPALLEAIDAIRRP